MPRLLSDITWAEELTNEVHPERDSLETYLKIRESVGLKGSVERQLLALAQDGSQGHKLLEGLILRHKAGTRFVREWQGKLHEVSVLSEGYQYNGHIYRSLSEIARKITGTRWSGPAFFGLKRRSKERVA